MKAWKKSAANSERSASRAAMSPNRAATGRNVIDRAAAIAIVAAAKVARGATAEVVKDRVAMARVANVRGAAATAHAARTIVRPVRNITAIWDRMLRDATSRLPATTSANR